jgi:hypothetical protein
LEIEPGARWILLVGTLLSPGALLATRLEVNEPTLALGALAMTIAASLRNLPMSRMWWWPVLAAAGRIEMAAATLLVGLVMLWSKRRSTGLVVSLAGALALGLTLTYLFHATGETASLSAHFAHLGSSPGEILNTVLVSPLSLLEPLTSREMWASVVFWLLPFGLLFPLGGLRWLVAALPLAGVAIFGVWPGADFYIHHYWYAFLVGGSMATAYALHRRAALIPYFRVLAVAGLLGSWAILAPAASGLRLGGTTRASDLRDVVALVRTLPEDGVSVPLPAAPHLVGRSDVMFFPRPFGCADIDIGPYREPAGLPRYLIVAGLSLGQPTGDPYLAALSRAITDRYAIVAEANFDVWELQSGTPIPCLPDPVPREG